MLSALSLYSAVTSFISELSSARFLFISLQASLYSFSPLIPTLVVIFTFLSAICYNPPNAMSMSSSPSAACGTAARSCLKMCGLYSLWYPNRVTIWYGVFLHASRSLYPSSTIAIYKSRAVSNFPARLSFPPPLRRPLFQYPCCFPRRLPCLLQTTQK